MTRAAWLLLALAACGDAVDEGVDAASSVDARVAPDAAAPDASEPDAGSAGPDAVSAEPDAAALDPDASTPTDGGVIPPPCPPGVICVDHFPFHHRSSTATGAPSALDRYSCAPSTDEGGPELVYRVELSEAGFLSAAVYDGAGVDVDVHILSALDASACLDRGDRGAKADVSAGTYYVVVDTYVSGGAPQPGDYDVDIGFVVPSEGPCDLQTGELARVNDGGNRLQMPATGPIVMEAHLVTQAEPPPYPTTSTEELSAHYALSQAESGFVMYRQQVWAPLEGGSFYGAGIGSPTLFPVLHEAWYVNMYWTASARPPRGTRMILRDPTSSRAVVVAAGYETGPGNLSHIAGTTEETHYYMGTRHLSVLQVGFAVDPNLPLGPRECR